MISIKLTIESSEQYLKEYIIIAEMDIYVQDDENDFQVIDSPVQIFDSFRQASKLKEIKIYEVSIHASRNEVDLNLLQNQFYQFQVKKYGQPFCQVQRRYSDFAMIFKIISKKCGGYIFPAFPENDIFAFMKTKVTIIKDQEFISRRIRVIERFFNKIFNDAQFDPASCPQMKEFLSAGKQFEAIKQIQSSSGEGILSFSWSKIRNIFTMNKQNKYVQFEKKIDELKIKYEHLYTKCRQLIDLMKQELKENKKLSQIQYISDHLAGYKNIILSYDERLKELLKEFQELQFTLFCENEDLMMGKKIIIRINELKNDEDNYKQVKSIQQSFSEKFNGFYEGKVVDHSKREDNLKDLIEKMKDLGRMND